MNTPKAKGPVIRVQRDEFREELEKMVKKPGRRIIQYLRGWRT